ncbi:MAG: hypothetical protein Q8L86_07800 [Vicinamibacterales bacterium]|nr:hypothetical protein [Vicinamibacterales bacterium]
MPAPTIAVGASCCLLLIVSCAPPPSEAPAGPTTAPRSAPVERTVTVTTDEAPPIGIATAGTVCGGSLFAVDPRHAAVHEIRLSDGVRVRTFGGHGDAPESLASPETAAVDCEQHALHVKDSRGLAQFDLETGTLVRRTAPAPGQFGVSLGWSFVHNRSLVLSGYWSQSPGDLADRALENALLGFSLGSRVDLSGDNARRPLLDLMSPACRQMGGDCFSTAALDLLPSGGWVGCQGHADHVGIYGDDGALLRTIDIRSPRFQNDGTVARGSASREARLRWQQRNSVVRSCFAFGEHIVTVHYTFTGEGGTPETGGAVPDVLMNVHHLDGTPVALDLSLRDMPVAKDATGLYVLVLGDARRTGGASRLELDVVRVIDETGALNTGSLP